MDFNRKVLVVIDTCIFFLHILDLIKGYFEAHNTTSHENYSKLTHCERPIPKGDKSFLPCLLVTYGSGTIIAKVNYHSVIVFHRAGFHAFTEML